MRMRLLICLVCMVGSWSASPAAAQLPGMSGTAQAVPTYQVLRPPVQIHRGHAYYPGQRQAVSAQTYAYGWFGAQPRAHWRRSTGFTSARLQWASQ
jgi:hypothetical protein